MLIFSFYYVNELGVITVSACVMQFLSQTHKTSVSIILFLYYHTEVSVLNVVVIKL